MAKKILIIDDEEILTKSFSLLLERNGYEVYTAKNGQDAQIMAEEEPFDLIICDIRMPGINGVETIKAIRSVGGAEQSKDIPVVFITGYADEKLEKEAQELNPLDYLYKPFDNEQILEKVRGALGT